MAGDEGALTALKLLVDWNLATTNVNVKLF
jgi:hypothetical protein